MRAKFVPAESLYPTTAPQMSVENKIMSPMSYGAVDYSAFSQPIGVAPSSIYQHVEAPMDQSMPSNDVFGMSDFVNQLTEEDEAPFLKSIPQHEILHNGTNGFVAKVAPKAPAFTISTNNKANGKSKFGFEYESLTEGIDDIELVNSSDKEWKTKLDQAKFELEIGNSQEAEKNFEGNDGKQRNKIQRFCFIWQQCV